MGFFGCRFNTQFWHFFFNIILFSFIPCFLIIVSTHSNLIINLLSLSLSRRIRDNNLSRKVLTPVSWNSPLSFNKVNFHILNIGIFFRVFTFIRRGSGGNPLRLTLFCQFRHCFNFKVLVKSDNMITRIFFNIYYNSCRTCI